MYSLNLTTVKKSISLLLCLTLFACSSTEQVSNINLSDNTYTQSYVSTNYFHNKFTTIESGSIKKPLSSDHQLMMSLLNRLMTEDQAMILAFAQERASYTSTFDNFSNNAVIIKGDKASENSNHRSKHVYAQQISQDINAVSITAPQ